MSGWDGLSSSGGSGGERGDRRGDREEDRPFPGASEDRLPAPSPPEGVMSWDEIMADKDLYESVLNEYWHNDSVSPISGKPLPADASEAETAERPDAGREPGGQGFEEDPDRDPLDVGERDREDQSADSQERQAPSAADNGDDAGPDRGHGRVVLDDVPGPAEDSGRDEESAEEPSRRSWADAAEQPSRVEGAAVRERATQDGDAQEQAAEDHSEGREREAEPVRERPRAQEHRPDARLDSGAEQTDEQRWAAMEQRMQSAMEQRLEAALDGIKADYEAKLDEQQAEHKAEVESIKAEYDSKETRSEARISELESNLEETQRLLQSVLDRDRDSGDRPEPASSPDATGFRERQAEGDSAALGAADLNAERSDIVGRIGETARSDLDVTDRTESDLAKAGKEGLGIAGSLALVNPALQMAMTADSARRTYNDLSPEDKYKVNEMMGTFVTASGSMSPGSAVAAVTIAAVIPTLRDKIHDAVGKIKRKERDEPELDHR